MSRRQHTNETWTRASSRGAEKSPNLLIPILSPSACSKAYINRKWENFVRLKMVHRKICFKQPATQQKHININIQFIINSWQLQSKHNIAPKITKQTQCIRWATNMIASLTPYSTQHIRLKLIPHINKKPKLWAYRSKSESNIFISVMIINVNITRSSHMYIK